MKIDISNLSAGYVYFVEKKKCYCASMSIGTTGYQRRVIFSIIDAE